MEERRAPVDIFFRTLADTHGPRAVSIVLSGTGPDGSNGVKRVKEHGGIIMAQDPSESESTTTCRATRSPPVSWTTSCRSATWRQGSRHWPVSSALAPPQDPQPSPSSRFRRPAGNRVVRQVAHRPRFLQLQVGDRAPADREAAAPARPAGHPGLCPLPTGPPGGGAGVAAGAADQRHPVLPRSRRVFARSSGGSSRACSTTSTRRIRCASG